MPGLLKLAAIVWFFGFMVFAIAAASSYVYSSEEQPLRAGRLARRLRMALLWPAALLSASGRSRLRRG